LVAHAAGDGVLDKVTSPFGWAVGKMLEAVQVAMGFLFSIAATIFGAIIDPNNVSGSRGILNNPAIKNIWIMVRDVLNMTFILILLFSAFCTIFQVEKWSLKKVWLNILINALLVNFSFTIARFIIDVSNVAMYYFVNNMFSMTGTVTGSGIMSNYASTTNLGAILAPNDFASQPLAYELMIIVFTFILGMSLLIIAVLFVIRLIALALLIMFSPIGFVGYIFPGTAEYADKWWKNLFNYAFFAPIMIFMMAIAFQVAKSIGEQNSNSFKASAMANSSGNDANFIAQAAFFAIPVALLWFGLGIAKGMSIAGADKVVDTGKKWGKGLAMKMSGANYLKKNYDQFKAKRDERQKEIDKKRWGGKLGDRANDISDKTRAGLPGGKDAKERYNKRKEAKNKEDIKNKSDSHEGTTNAALHADINAITDPSTMSDKEVMEAAGKVKQALSRGAAYEKQVETVLKGMTAGSTGLTGTIKPPDVVKAAITPGMTSADIAIERDREKKEKDALDKWIQEEKVAHMDQARDVIKNAESRGKMS